MAPPPTVPVVDRTDALPVALHLGGPDVDGVRRWIENVAGWQPVDAATSALVPPRLTIVDQTAAADRDGTPVVLLVRDGDSPAQVARAATGWRPDEVLSWPDDRDRLPEVAAALLDRRSQTASATAELTVGGAAGGVGTTTVTLALAGLATWRGHRTLVVTSGPVPSPVADRVEPESLSGSQTWATARAAPGVPGLRVVATTRPAIGVPVDAGGADLVVRDAGVRDDVDVLVLRRDAAGLAALQGSVAAAAVLVDSGVAPPGAVRAAARHRRLTTVPYSARVARAGLARRVPAGLPGAWLRALAPVLRSGSG